MKSTSLVTIGICFNDRFAFAINNGSSQDDIVSPLRRVLLDHLIAFLATGHESQFLELHSRCIARLMNQVLGFGVESMIGWLVVVAELIFSTYWSADTAVWLARLLLVFMQLVVIR